jgi:uncharacterized protein
MTDETQQTESTEPSDSGSPSKDARTMAMLAHLLGIVLGFLGPLIIWLIKKDEEPFVDDQGKEALNFQITVLIGILVSGVLMFVCVGFFTALAIAIANIVLCIMGGLKANEGVAYRYPLTLRLIK